MCLQLGLRSTVPHSLLWSLYSLRCPCRSLTLCSWADTGLSARWRSLWAPLAQGCLLQAARALASQRLSCSWSITAALGGEEILNISKASVWCTMQQPSVPFHSANDSVDIPFNAGLIFCAYNSSLMLIHQLLAMYSAIPTFKYVLLLGTALLGY